MATQVSQLLDWRGAAERLNTSERHVQRLWAERKLPGVKVGKFVRFKPGDIDLFIMRNRVGS